jgi:GntP family gluconate:H+ symporter
MWTGHDTALIIYAVLAVALVVILVAVLKLHAFVALTIASLAMGLAGGLGVDKVVTSFEAGAGKVFGSVGVLVALGTMLGKLLVESGGAQRIADTVLSRAGDRGVPWAMALVAMIVGIPLFFEIGLVLLMPIIFAAAQRVQTRGVERGGNAYLLVGIPALAGLSVLHGLVPPHPGPLLAISALGAPIGTTILYGLIVAIPTVIIAGPLFARVAMRWAQADPPQALIEQLAGDERSESAPRFSVTLATVLLPVALMLIRAGTDVALGKSNHVREWADFIGDPATALLIGVLVALWTFGVARGFDRNRLNRFCTDALAPTATIVFIIGAGGGFNGVLVDSGIGTAIGKGVNGLSISALLLGWFVAVLIRVATGSATVATITAAGIMVPIAAHTSVDRPLLALAIGCGSLFFSQVNDAGFWLVNQYFGMSVPDTLKSWSVMETIVSTVGLACVMLLSLIV